MNREDRKRFKLLFLLVKPWWLPYSISTFIVASRNFIITWLMTWISSVVLNSALLRESKYLFYHIIWFIFILFIYLIIDAFGIYLQQITIHSMEIHIRNSMFTNLLKSSMNNIDKFGNRGEVLSRMNQDIHTAISIFSYTLLSPFMYLISGIGATIIIFSIEWKVVIFIYIIGIIGTIIQMRIAYKNRNYQYEIQKVRAGALELFLESYHYSSAVKMINLGKFIQLKLENIVKNFQKQYKRIAKNSSISNGVSGVITFLNGMGIVFLGIYLYNKKEIELSDIIILYNMTALIFAMISSISSAFASLQSSMVGIERLTEIMNLPLEEETIKPKITPIPILAEKESIRAEKLECCFKNGYKAFENISFLIKARSITAITGKSGCGKSTVLRLLCRLYPYKGKLLYCDKEIAALGYLSLRERITYVSQENLILEGSLKENLIVGNCRKNITEEEIWECLDLASAKEWVLELPEKLSTKLSEGGKQLSGGQKKTLALTRAFLKKTEILILDEVFAGIDEKRIDRIMKSLHKLKSATTIIVVTHDRRVLKQCNHVIYFRKNSKIKS